jgi:hypothetical protein
MEGLGTISRAESEGGTGKMAWVGGRVGLGTITEDHFVCGLGNVGRPRALEGLGIISRPGGRADRGKWPGYLGGQK